MVESDLMRKEVICLLAFGIILFMIGLGAYFYKEERTIHYESGWWGDYPKTIVKVSYPYQEIGVVLVLVGIILISASLLLSLKTKAKSESASGGSRQPRRIKRYKKRGKGYS